MFVITGNGVIFSQSESQLLHKLFEERVAPNVVCKNSTINQVVNGDSNNSTPLNHSNGMFKFKTDASQSGHVFDKTSSKILQVSQLSISSLTIVDCSLNEQCVTQEVKDIMTNQFIQLEQHLDAIQNEMHHHSLCQSNLCEQNDHISFVALVAEVHHAHVCCSISSATNSKSFVLMSCHFALAIAIAIVSSPWSHVCKRRG